MMKSFAMGAVSLLILLGAQDSVRSWTGEDPAPAFPCVFSSTAVSGYSKGARTYEFVASCSDWTGSFVARGSWDPVSKKASERINNGQWLMETSATCEADPWTTGAPCSGTKYYIRDPNHPNEQPSPGAIMAPVSARVSGLPRDQLQAKLASLPASAPPPPAPDMPPRNVRAVQQPTQPVTVFWAPPADQTSLHKTVQWYQCERRPVGGPNWFSASGILAVQNTQCRDPDRPQVKTEYRVCAGNAGGKKCSESVLPEANMRVTTSTPNVIRAADATLASAVVEKLRHDLPALQPRIQVSASNGIVTLAGSVATLQDKVAVETSVKNVEGIRGLQDNITLATAAPATRVLNQGLKR